MMTAGTAQAQMRALPFTDVASISGGRPALVLAPHPDDEVLGCGGFIAQSVTGGNPPILVVLTDGTGSHPHSRAYSPTRLLALREQETRNAAAILGLSDERIRFLRFRDTAAPQDGTDFADAVGQVCSLARTFGCGSVLATWRFDPHCDHLAAHLIAAAAARRSRMRHLSYPVWGWTLPASTPLAAAEITGWRLDLAGMDKSPALAAHASQLGAVVDDDPTGFVLDAATIARISPGFEVFLCNP